MPDTESDEVLANTFADYLVERISKIRDELHSYPKYSPEHMDMSSWHISSCLCRVHLKGNKTNG